MENNILVEGPSGSGKSTLCRHYATNLSKTRTVLYYSVGISDIETDLLLSITGPLMAPLVLWWCKISNQSILSFWYRAVVKCSKREAMRPVIFIDLGNGNSINNPLIPALLNLASTSSGFCQFVFIASDYGAHTIHTTSRYSLKSFRFIFVGCVEHDEALELLSLAHVPPLFQNEVLEICGHLLVHLSECFTISEDEDMHWLKETIAIDIRDRLVHSNLSVGDPAFAAFIQDFQSSKKDEVELKVLQKHFPKKEQMDSIIRGNALYFCGDGPVRFQSKVIMNYVVKRMCNEYSQIIK